MKKLTIILLSLLILALCGFLIFNSLWKTEKTENIDNKNTATDSSNNAAKQKETNFFLTVTDFEDISDESGFNDHFNTKKAKSSKVYKIDFKTRQDFQKELHIESDPEIVYHDFCKKDDGSIYAVWWKFWTEYETARLVKIYPKVEDKILFNSSEIRVRDCDFIKDADTQKIWMVTHWEWRVYLYDVDTNWIISDLDSTYDKTKAYTWVTMIHEVVTSDLNWDWNEELYLTPTTKNVSTYKEQRWKINKVEKINWEYVISELIDFEDRYAKEVDAIEINGKKAVLVSLQWQKNNLKETREKSKAKRELRKEWKIEEAETIWEVSIIKNPVELILLYEKDGEFKNKKLAEIETDQCRVLDSWNFWYEWLWIILWCKNGILNLYSLEEKDGEYELIEKDTMRFPEKQIHSFYPVDTDLDGVDEVFIWVDFDWLYHFDLAEEDKLFKMYDYTEVESWLWALEGMN